MYLVGLPGPNSLLKTKKQKRTRLVIIVIKAEYIRFMCEIDILEEEQVILPPAQRGKHLSDTLL